MDFWRHLFSKITVSSFDKFDKSPALRNHLADTVTFLLPAYSMFWYKAEYSTPDVGSESAGAPLPDKLHCAKCVYKARKDNWRPLVLFIGNFPNGQCKFLDEVYPIQHSTTSTKEFAIVYGMNFLYNTFHFP